MRLISIARIAACTRRLVARAWSTLDPRPAARDLAAAGRDLCRSRRDLIVENAVLRHQLGILRRRCQRSRLHLQDRLRLLLGARLLEHWRAAILVVQPDTLIRWHRAGFRLFWRRRSRPHKASPLPNETLDLIRDMARRGRLWGAERIRGELLKLGIRVSKRTIHAGRPKPARWRPDLGDFPPKPHRSHRAY